MPASPHPSSGPAARAAGLLAGTAWLLAGVLGLPQAIGVPFLPLLPVAALAGWWLARSGRARLVEWAVGALLVLLAVAGFTPLLDAGVRAIVRTEHVPQDPQDAVVVLSANLTRDGMLTPAGSERLLAGVSLLDRGVAGVVVTSRIRRVVSGDTLVSDPAQAGYLALAPDSVRWIVVDSVASTHDEAVRVGELARRQGWSRLVIVTSPLHSRRACAAFETVGLAVTCAPSGSMEYPVSASGSPGDRWRRLAPWLHEVIGWWWYRLRGWV